MKLRFLILCMIFLSASCMAQSVFKMQTYSDDQYPKLSFNYSFVPETVHYNYQPEVRVFENGNTCQISSNTSSCPFEQLTFHFFLSNPLPNFKERDYLLEYGKKIMENNLIKVESRFHAQQGDSLMMSLPLSESVTSILDSLRFNLSIPEIINYYTQNKNDFHQNDILIFFINRAAYDDFRLLNINLPMDNSLTRPLIILIHDGIKPPRGESISNSLAFPLLVIEKKEFETKSKENLTDFLSPWIYRNFETTFSLPEELKLESLRNYKLDIQNVIKPYTFEIPIHINKHKIEEHFKMLTMQESKNLFKEGKVLEEIRLIKSREMDYRKAGFPDDFFTQHGYVLIKEYGQKLANEKNTDALKLFKEAEKIFGPSYTPEYRTSKIQIFEHLFTNYDGVASYEDKCIILADTLANLYNSKLNQFRQNKSRGDKYRSIQKYWEAADAYTKAIGVQPSSSLQAIRSKTVFDAVNQSYNKKEWNLIFENGTRYKNIIDSEFNLRLCFAHAALESSHFKVAFDEFDWLIANWNDQPIMDWTTAFNNLRTTLSSTSNYNRALALSRQIFVDKNTAPKGQTDIGLYLYLLNARAKFYQPLADLAPMVLTSGSNVSARNLGDTDELTFVGIIDRSLNLVKTIVNKEKPTIKSSDILNAKTFPFFITDTAASYGWIVNKIENNYFLIQINNRKNSDEEKILLDRIIASPMMGQNWNSLFALQETKGITFTSKTLAAFIETGLARGINLRNVWSRLSQQDFIKYMVHHPPGRDEVAFGKPPEASEYAQGERAKSSTSIAFYELAINKENTSIRDVSNPLLVNGKYEGVIRFGFEKR
jgi:hypothetical protein